MATESGKSKAIAVRTFLKVLRPFSRTLRSLDRIEELHGKCTLPELVRTVESQCCSLAPADLAGLQRIIKRRRFWRFVHAAVRKNPCLYFSMLVFAFEISRGRSVEVNVRLATNHCDAKDGHCWISRDGEALYEPAGAADAHGQMFLARRDRLVYWWQTATGSMSHAKTQEP